MSVDTLGMVLHPQQVTVQLTREVAWLLGILAVIGVGTCIATVQETWQHMKQRAREAWIRRAL